MKLKQIKTVLILPALFAGVLLGSLLSPAEDASALTQAEKKACYEKWAGRANGPAGDGADFNEANFKKDKCSSAQKGSCKIVRYSDGAVIHCQRKDSKYDNGSAGWGGTTGGSDTGGTGDDGKDSGSAGTLGTGNDCGGAETAIIKCDADNKGGVANNGVWALLLMVINIMTAGVGVLAIGGIVYGSILYTTAEDHADQVKKATDIITNVVIGLVAFALMWAGLNFIIPGGVFA